MKETWIAFIIACNPNMVCNGERTYAKEAQYLEQICLSFAYGWAIQMKAYTNKNYGYGCKKNDYIPPLIKE